MRFDIRGSGFFSQVNSLLAIASHPIYTPRSGFSSRRLAALSRAEAITLFPRSFPLPSRLCSSCCVVRNVCPFCKKGERAAGRERESGEKERERKMLRLLFRDRNYARHFASLVTSDVKAGSIVKSHACDEEEEGRGERDEKTRIFLIRRERARMYIVTRYVTLFKRGKGEVEREEEMKKWEKTIPDSVRKSASVSAMCYRLRAPIYSERK